MSRTDEAAPRTTSARPPFDLERIRREFPALKREVYGKPLAYLDNAATAHKPASVIEVMDHFYRELNSNVHRGVHRLSQEATDAFERAREKVARFLHAQSTREVIFTRGTTEGVNLVAQTYGRRHVQAGDEILISALEHHSNIVPWQILAEEKGARVRVIPMDQRGVLTLEALPTLLSERTKIVAVTHVSNALGTVNPLSTIIAAAHERGIPVLVDGAQAVPHTAVDVRALDADWYVFSGHKLFGPTGIGVLYGRESLLAAMPPWQGGGDMISSVTFEKSTWNELPYKFEAGTPDIAGAIGLGAAIDFVDRVGYPTIAAWEHSLLEYGTEKLTAVPGLRLIGTAPGKASVLSFVVDGIHAHDLGTILDREGVAIRAGHHCAQPVMDFYGIAATARASLAFYNSIDEIDRLVRAVRKAQEIFGP
jgi:cysteine desulfurase/selenocysteine lyase